MSAKVEITASGADENEVAAVLTDIKRLTEGLDGVGVSETIVERQPGMAEALFAGQLALNILLPIASGLAVNAIWAWILSKNGTLKSEPEKHPERPMKVEIGNVTVIVMLDQTDGDD